MSKKHIKFKHFIETLVQIIEDKTKISYSWPIYCFLVIVLFSHKFSFLFNTYATVRMIDDKLIFWAHWMEYSKGTFLLYVIGNDALTTAFFVIFQILLYGYILYIILITIIRLKKPSWLQEMQTTIKLMNYILQFFFSSFLWIFYIPFTELFAGISFCSKNSFFIEYRKQENCTRKPSYQIFLGIFGIILTFLSGIIINIFYINYDFLDKNLLKRRFRGNLILQIFLRTLLVVFYYIDTSGSVIIKHICAHLLGVVCIYDYLMFMPFKDSRISIFYGSCSVIYEITNIFFSLWELSGTFAEYNLFWVWLLVMPVLAGLISIYHYQHYHKVMNLDFNKNSFHLTNSDQYFEEIFVLSSTSENNKQSKMFLMGLFKHHLRRCKDELCILRHDRDGAKYMTSFQQMDMSKITKIINNLFTRFLDQPFFTKPEEKEHLLLKYCSFLANFQDNSRLAYFELKSLLHRSVGHNNKNEKNSLFFRILSKILSRNIELMIRQTQQASSFQRKNIDKKELAVNIFFYYLKIVYSESFAKFDEVKNKAIPIFLEIAEIKFQFFDQLLKGYSRIERFHELVMKMVYKIFEVNNFFKILYNSTEEKDNIIFLKISVMYYGIVLNDIQMIQKNENKFAEVKRREAFLAKDNITSLTILEGSTILLTASLLKETGMILTEKTNRLANFFGYQNKMDFETIKNIGQVMPKLISPHHSSFIRRFFIEGTTRFLGTYRSTFCQDKEEFVFPVKLYLHLNFTYSGNFAMNAILTKCESSASYLIADENGWINQCSRTFLNEFNIDPSDSKQYLKISNVLQIFPDLHEKINWELCSKHNFQKQAQLEMLFNEKVIVAIPEDPKDFGHYLYDIYKEKSKKTAGSKSMNSFAKKSNKSGGSNNSSKALSKLGSSKNIIINLSVFNDDQRIEILGVFDEYRRKKKMKYFMTLMNIQIDSFVKEKGEMYKMMIIEIKEKLDERYDTENKITSEYLKTKLKTAGNTTVDDMRKTKADDDSKTMDNKISNDFDVSKTIENSEFLNNTNVDINEKFNEVIKSDDSNNAKMNENPEEENKIKSQDQIDLNSDVLNPEMHKNDPKDFNQPLKKEADILDASCLKSEVVVDSDFEDSKMKIEEHEIKDENLVASSTSEKKVIELASSDKYKIDNSDDDEQERNNLEKKGVSARSKSSGSTIASSIGSNYIKTLINNSKPPKLPNKVGFLFLIFVLFFLIINCLYLILVNQKLNSFREYAILILKPNYIIVSHSRSLWTANIENYFFLRINWMESSQLTRDIIDIFMNVQLNDKESIIFFYVILSVIGLTISIIIDLALYPLIKKFYAYTEQILTIISRITEDEAEIEWEKFKLQVDQLKSANESFLQYNFQETERKILQKRKLQMNKERRKTGRANFMTSRIMNPHFSIFKVWITIFVIFIIITAYFSGLFGFLSNMKAGLENPYKLNKKTYQILNSLDSLLIIQDLIMFSDYVDAKNILSTDEIEKFKQVFSSNIDFLEEFVTKSTLEFFGDQVLSKNILKKLQDILIIDICQNTLKGTKECVNLEDNSFRYGLIGYVSKILKQGREYYKIFTRENIVDLNHLKAIYNQNFLSQYLMETKIKDEISLIFLNIVEEANKDIMNSLYNNLVLIILLGGFSVLFFLMIYSLYVFRSIKNQLIAIRASLLIIPVKKLTDSTMLQLFKKIENI